MSMNPNVPPESAWKGHLRHESCVLRHLQYWTVYYLCKHMQAGNSKGERGDVITPQNGRKQSCLVWKHPQTAETLNTEAAYRNKTLEHKKSLHVSWAKFVCLKQNEAHVRGKLESVCGLSLSKNCFGLFPPLFGKYCNNSLTLFRISSDWSWKDGQLLWFNKE